MIAWWILVCNLPHIKSDAWLVTCVIDDMWQVAARADIKIKKLSTRKNDNEMLQYKRSNNWYYLNLGKASSEVYNFLWKKTLSLEKKSVYTVHMGSYGDHVWVWVNTSGLIPGVSTSANGETKRLFKKVSELNMIDASLKKNLHICWRKTFL